MLKLHVNSLKEFQRRAAQIQTNTLLPVCSNLKLEPNLITKHSLSAAIIGKVETLGDNESYLVDERILFALANGTKSDWIEVYNENLQTVLKDDTGLTFLPIIPVVDFPAIPEFDRNTGIIVLDQHHIKAINIASNFINDVETAGTLRFVHLDVDSIYAVNNNYFYINGRFKDLPTVAFSSEEASIITSQEKIEFINLSNHHVFFTPGYDYIFTKSESGKININGIMERLRLPGKNFTCNTDELCNFINYANNVSESPIATCTLNPEGLFIKLSINDSNFNRGHERMIACTGEPEEFTFNSRLVATPIKAIPYSTLNAKTNQNCLIVQNDSEWFCFIGMSKN